jgi:hypothetical protein
MTPAFDPSTSEPSELRAAVSPAAPAGAQQAGTLLAHDEGAAITAAATYFGADDSRLVVRVIVSTEVLGYLDRDQALSLVPSQSRDLGHSSGQFVPGISFYEGIELRCPVAGCAANPIVATTFDAAHPPHCPVHRDRALARAEQP